MAIEIRENQTRVEAAHAHQQISKQGCLLIDVRSFDEFAAGHAEQARCIPISDLERRAGEIPTDRPVFVMCASGGRSQMASERLRALGFNNVVDVEGGFTAWKRAGLPFQEQKGVIPLERQVRGVAGTIVFVFTLLGLLVNKGFLSVSLFVGFMLLLSGVTGLCPMLVILKKMPWNRVLSQSNAPCEKA